jgi:hypothetical protein
MFPTKADLDEQERFIKEELEPRLEEAESSQRVVFFVDAAHFDARANINTSNARFGQL